jgi:hypothetical protein
MYFCLNLKNIIMQNQQEQELTQEQLAEKKEQMLSFYTESMPYLSAQLAYEKIVLEIDEARFKRSSMQMQYAMMMQSQEEESKKTDEDSEPATSPQ